jgi:hypothetical protein
VAVASPLTGKKKRCTVTKFNGDKRSLGHATNGGNIMVSKIIIALAAVIFAGAVPASTTADKPPRLTAFGS